MHLIYFVPGTMCTEKLWGELWPLLPEQYELVHLNISDTGEMDDVVSNLVEQIEISSNGRNFSLLGFSLGGYLASAVSLHLGSQLQRLMVVANTPMKLPQAELIQRQRIVSTVKKFGHQGINFERCCSFLAASQHRNLALIELIQAMEKSFDEEQLGHFLVPLSERQDLCQQLAQSHYPVWFCSGDEDSLVDVPLMESLAARHSHIRYQQVSNCGHFMPLEQPQVLATQMNLWLSMQ